jgi:ubiquitin carboxyl-terminal hydrolase 14
LGENQAEVKKQKAINEKKDIASAEVVDSGDAEIETRATRRALYDTIGVEAGLASDVGANESGWYDLVAVLTHVGRTAESGHYVGWVKIGKQWCMFPR